jgi:hypothetical protein
MSDSIGAVMQTQATTGTQEPSLAQLVAARDAAPEHQTNPVPTDTVHLSGEAQSKSGDATNSVAARAQEAAQATLNPVKQIAKQNSEQPAPKPVHVVA